MLKREDIIMLSAVQKFSFGKKSQFQCTNYNCLRSYNINSTPIADSVSFKSNATSAPYDLLHSIEVSVIKLREVFKYIANADNFWTSETRFFQKRTSGKIEFSKRQMLSSDDDSILINLTMPTNDGNKLTIGFDKNPNKKYFYQVPGKEIITSVFNRNLEGGVANYHVGMFSGGVECSNGLNLSKWEQVEDDAMLPKLQVYLGEVIEELKNSEVLKTLVED